MQIMDCSAKKDVPRIKSDKSARRCPPDFCLIFSNVNNMASHLLQILPTISTMEGTTIRDKVYDYLL